jgi:cytochrome c oxidase assembly factor CtaG
VAQPRRTGEGGVVDPGAIVVAVVAAGVYGRGVVRLRAKRRWPPARSAAWGAAIVVGLAAASLDDTTDLRAHMVQHIGLGMVVPLLASLAAPLTLALQAGGPATSRALRNALRSPAGRALAHPVVGWALFGGGLVAVYLTPLLDVSARNPVVHTAVHAHLVLAGFLFLVPLVGTDVLPHPLPHGARLVAVLVAVPFHAFVGAALLTADRPVAPVAYPSIDRQHAAAAILMGSGELLSLVLAALVFRRWWSAAGAGRDPS